MVLRHNVNLSYLPETVNFTLLFKFKVYGSKVKHKQRNQTLNGELLINYTELNKSKVTYRNYILYTFR